MPVKDGFNETNFALIVVEKLLIFKIINILTEMGYFHAQKIILLD